MIGVKVLIAPLLVAFPANLVALQLEITRSRRNVMCGVAGGASGRFVAPVSEGFRVLAELELLLDPCVALAASILNVVVRYGLLWIVRPTQLMSLAVTIRTRWSHREALRHQGSAMNTLEIVRSR